MCKALTHVLILRVAPSSLFYGCVYLVICTINHRGYTFDLEPFEVLSAFIYVGKGKKKTTQNAKWFLNVLTVALSCKRLAEDFCRIPSRGLCAQTRLCSKGATKTASLCRKRWNDREKRLENIVKRIVKPQGTMHVALFMFCASFHDSWNKDKQVVIRVFGWYIHNFVYDDLDVKRTSLLY